MIILIAGAVERLLQKMLGDSRRESVNLPLTKPTRGRQMAHLPSKVATPPKRLAATSPIAQRFSKALSFANSQAAKTEKVQAALTAARNGDGLFGIKK